MPEKTLKKINSYILPQWKVCFLAAVLIGMLAHLYKITNWLPNWDSLVFRYHSQNMIALGRWFLPVVCSFSSFYDLPFLNGITAIIFHALGAVCILRIFNIKKKITAGLIGGIVVSVPTVTSVMMYNYVADGYSIAFFISVLAAYYMTKEKPAYLLSAVFVALSAGIYQAYITVTITLVLLKLIDETVYKNTASGVILKKTLHILLWGIIGG
ncbi:MAG: glucosyltransferase domain-containing protein, partial [Clostridia bacterium]|nr:glucosyltransferase domain-containing protein [Clostridia bacterium]